MIEEPVLRGYVLEEVLARLLRQNGYRLLVRASQDTDALRDDHHGLLVRGRGSDHQADALGELLIPTPFSLPLRLFAEAKFKSKPTAISDVRNALGVLSDVNEHYATDARYDFPLRHHHYRYALFSVSGFTVDAQRYALAQQISLIDLQGHAFADMRAVTGQAAGRLLQLAQRSGLNSFPVRQMRTVLRRALGTWSIDGESEETGFEASFARAARAPDAPTDEGKHDLPSEPLARIAANLSEELDDILIFGFPQGPFILVLQPDDPQAFEDFLRDSPPEIEVDIRYASGNGASGEWAIVPVPGRDDLIVRFGIPPLLDSWLLAADAVEQERAALAKQTLFSTIMIFRHGNRLTQLRYRKVTRPESTADDALSDAVPVLRRELASPDLAFKGRRERDYAGPLHDEDLDMRVDENLDIPESTDRVTQLPKAGMRLGRGRTGDQQWTLDGLAELLSRLDEQRPLQAQVIRAAARQHGQVPRRLIYQLGGYEAGRTLRGFTRPVHRITRQLQRERLVAEGVAPALEAIYGQGGQATHFVIPADVRQLLTESPNAAFTGTYDLLAAIPDENYRQHLQDIFGALSSIDGLAVRRGTSGYSFRVTRPNRMPLSIGWLFPPGRPRWMGLSDLTLGWYEYDKGATVPDSDKAALESYFQTLSTLDGEPRPQSGVIRGWTFRPAGVIEHTNELTEAMRTVVSSLLES